MLSINYDFSVMFTNSIDKEWLHKMVSYIVSDFSPLFTWTTNNYSEQNTDERIQAEATPHYNSETKIDCIKRGRKAATCWPH